MFQLWWSESACVSGLAGFRDVSAATSQLQSTQICVSHLDDIKDVSKALFQLWLSSHFPAKVLRVTLVRRCRGETFPDRFPQPCSCGAPFSWGLRSRCFSRCFNSHVLATVPPLVPHINLRLGSSFSLRLVRLSLLSPTVCFAPSRVTLHSALFYLLKLGPLCCVGCQCNWRRRCSAVLDRRLNLSGLAQSQLVVVLSLSIADMTFASLQRARKTS